MKDYLTIVRALLAALALVLLAPDALAQANGDACSVGTTCTSGFCVDDVCCDLACDGLCQACSAEAKGTGADGVCGNAAELTVCNQATCGSPGFSFTPADTCDASGVCVDGGPPVDCLQNDGVCAFDLCHDQNGCEVVKAVDGTECGEDMTCFDGACVEGGASSTGSLGTTGAATTGAGGGVGGSTDTGFGGAGGVIEGGGLDVNTGCSCRTAGLERNGSGALWLTLLGALVAFGRRRRHSNML